MGVDISLQNKARSTTGIVLVVFRDPDDPVDTSAVIERTVAVSGSADTGSWSQIGIIPNCDTAGSHFIDYLPSTNDVFFYRAKHVAPGFADSDWVFETSGSAQIIPDIDWTKKPWLLDKSPLQLVMAVTNFDTGSWTVEPMVNQPVFGFSSDTPVISIFDSGSVGNITTGSSNEWIIDRPSGSVTGSFIIFKSELAGFQPGFDYVPLEEYDDFEASEFLRLLLIESGSDADYARVKTVQANPSISGSLFYGIISASNVGPVTQSAADYFTIPRPVSGVGTVVFQVTSSNVSYVTDYDVLTLDPDMNLTANQFLQLKLSVSASDSASITLSASCDTPHPVGFGVVDYHNVPGVTQINGNSWKLLRPASGLGDVTFIVSSSISTVVPDIDTFYISKDPAPYLTVQAQNISSDNTSITASVEVIDSQVTDAILTGITVTPTFVSMSGFSVSQVGAVSSSIGKNSYTYHITRPDYSYGTGRATFIATKNGYTRDSDSIEVPERVDNLAKLLVEAEVMGTTAKDISVRVRVKDALPLSGSYISLSAGRIGVPSVSPTGSIQIPVNTYQTYSIERPDFGSGTGRVVFTATAFNRLEDVESVDVPAKSIDTVSPGSAIINIDSYTVDADKITVNYSFPANSTAESVRVYTQEVTGAAPSITSVEFSGIQLVDSPLYKNDGRSSVTIPVSVPSSYVLMTFVPFDVIGRRAVPWTVRYQAASTPLTPPNAPSSAGNVSVGDTSVVNRVTMPASSLPDKIRVYRNNVMLGDVARTAGASSNQNITHTGLTPGNTYTWAYSGVSNAGAETSKTSPFDTTTTSQTLSTPQISFVGWQSQDGGVLIYQILNSGDYSMGGVSFEGRVYNSSNVLIGSFTQLTEYTVGMTYSGPGSDVGSADVRAVKTGYSTSGYSTRINWNNSGGYDI